ncbi:MAG: HD domain-containing protein [Desulfobacterales bacterium]|nr:HD domain-containing protein [Desulfobacterales bacterium]
MDGDDGTRNSVPSRDFCFRLMARYGMLANIRAHSILVARIAEALSLDLARAGLKLTPELAVAGGLLHDIGKTLCLNTGRDHARVGRDICLGHDLDTIAPIVAEHVILTNYSAEQPITEKEIVYYADKRVNHDQVVSLADRLAYIIATYGRDNPRIQSKIKKNYIRCQELEARIFAHLDFPCQYLAARVKKQPWEEPGYF